MRHLGLASRVLARLSESGSTAVAVIAAPTTPRTLRFHADGGQVGVDVVREIYALAQQVDAAAADWVRDRQEVETKLESRG